jgi:serine-type D-Ala-D-Ala carboxypeptidase/endopeptidase (penicillin-binding protein 4)
MKKKYWILIIALILVNACTVQKKTILNLWINNGLSNPVFSNYQIGFSLYDLAAQMPVFEHNANKFFIPASNTKLLTFYAGLCALADSVATLKYITSNDSLFIYPQGDPAFLHPNFAQQPAFDFLKNNHKNIFLVYDTYEGEKFGYGWSWDDYNKSYATQITEMPLYGNMIALSCTQGKLRIQPDLPSMFLCDTASQSKLTEAHRAETNNNITLPTSLNNNFTQKIPLYLDSKTVIALLSDTLLATGLITKEVKPLLCTKKIETAKKIYTTAADTLYKHMLQQSDNFIAEQLLLCIAYNNNLATKQDSVIKYIKSNFLGFLPDTLQWVDGSGLSRLNLNTPRNFTSLLNAIYLKAGEKKCFELLSTGGVNGTLKNLFKNTGKPYVYAKTGTVLNNYCLSGFLIGNSGKRYAFSFMNNNYMVGTLQAKREVEKFITQLRENL